MEHMKTASANRGKAARQPAEVERGPQRVRREPRFFREAGVALVSIPTTTPGKAVIADAADFHAYMARGFSDQWFLNSNGKGRSYVKVGLSKTSGNLATVARLLLGTPGGTRIRYADGNRLNLRRSNIENHKGYSKGREKAAVSAAEAAHSA